MFGAIFMIAVAAFISYSPIQLVIQYYIHIRLINLPTIEKLLNKLLDD
jgi:hypothetical protein